MFSQATLLPALLFASPCALAQITVTAGPTPAPVGSSVFISVTNDTDSITDILGCPWRVRDVATNSIIFTPTCLPFATVFGPLGTLDFEWEQIDSNGDPVPPGEYILESAFFAPSFDTIVVGGVDANLYVQGTAALGTSALGFGGREIFVTSPQDPGQVYAVFMSQSLGSGLGDCGLQLPILPDALFNAVLAGGLIPNSVGFLDAEGQTVSPLLPIPDNANLLGLELHLAAAVLDFNSPCPLIRVTPAFTTTISPGPQPIGG